MNLKKNKTSTKHQEQKLEIKRMMNEVEILIIKRVKL